MIKATLTSPEGRTLLALGLSFGNLDKFRALPGDTFIKINGADLNLPIDVLIFSGRTEDEMGAMMAQFIGPDTKLHIDRKRNGEKNRRRGESANNPTRRRSS